MAARSIQVPLACLLGVAAVCTGCDKSMWYFILPESKQPAELKRLAAEDPKKTVRAAILTYMSLETRPELIQADRQLSELLARQIKELCEANEEKVEIVPPRKVEEYKNSHPTWHQRDLAEVGRDLRADYVIYLEVNALSLYEKGSANMMFRGRADIGVSLVDVNNPDDYPERKSFACVYPSDARGPVDGSLDTNPLQFRQAFLVYMAKRLSWYFAPYSRRENYLVEF